MSAIRMDVVGDLCGNKYSVPSVSKGGAGAEVRREWRWLYRAAKGLVSNTRAVRLAAGTAWIVTSRARGGDEGG